MDKHISELMPNELSDAFRSQVSKLKQRDQNKTLFKLVICLRHDYSKQCRRLNEFNVVVSRVIQNDD